MRASFLRVIRITAQQVRVVRRGRDTASREDTRYSAAPHSPTFTLMVLTTDRRAFVVA